MRPHQTEALQALRVLGAKDSVPEDKLVEAENIIKKDKPMDVGLLRWFRRNNYDVTAGVLYGYRTSRGMYLRKKASGPNNNAIKTAFEKAGVKRKRL